MTAAVYTVLQREVLNVLIEYLNNDFPLLGPSLLGPFLDVGDLLSAAVLIALLVLLLDGVRVVVGARYLWFEIRAVAPSTTEEAGLADSRSKSFYFGGLTICLPRYLSRAR